MKLEVKIPSVGESVTEATVSSWNKKSGEFVRANELLLLIETDKASVEVVAEKEGVLTITTEAGSTVPIGTVVGSIDTSASAPAAAPSASKAAPTIATPTAAPASVSAAGFETSTHLSPAVQKIVTEKGLDPSEIKGTGKDGRLTKEDVLTAKPMSASTATTAAPMTTPPKSAPVTIPAPARVGSRQGEIERVPMNNIRRRIAERLVEAQHTAAILTTFNEIDMTRVNEVRAKYKDIFKEKYGTSLGFMGFFTKAVIEALKAYPAVNASIEGTDIIYKKFFNIGCAVGTEKGLIVPVIKDADLLSIAGIEQAIKHFALKARDGKITVDDLSGGTFTLSNGGVYGSLMSTPILNYPQVGILGMHKVEDRPMAINGKVEIRPMMYVALSYDHRIIDGKEAVGFLVKVKECVENPERLLLEI
ncbi:MAG: 2-oxoglutarate dehydrogenase, component, dihydrolipoamide succinyltransferase [Pseudomonadota bacterium]